MICAKQVLFPALLAGFALAACWSVRLACADFWFRQQTLRGTERALALTPGRADYYLRLALLEPPACQATARDALLRAVALNPSDATSWIELGLRYEDSGDRTGAEKCLLRAAAEDRQYLPRWTLMNYYFRVQRLEEFWFWAKKAVEKAPGDVMPLFRLCGKVMEDGALMDRLEVRRPDVKTAYLYYLLAGGRLDLAGRASRPLLIDTRISDVPVLLATCDRLLDTKNVAGALEIWNSLAAQQRIPFGRLQPADGQVLTNGDFQASPLSQGFDWRLPVLAGVSGSADEGGGLRLTFSGGQAESCEPIFQVAPVQEKTHYQLQFDYRTGGVAPGSGLEWRITNQDGSVSMADAYELSSNRGENGHIDFVTSPNCRAARVALAYRRGVGTTRIAGWILLRSVKLKSQPAR